MVQIKLIAITLIVLWMNKSRTLGAKVTFNRMKLSERNYQNDEGAAASVNRCNELPPVVLNDILGAAFNSRYMSIEEPTLEEELEQKNAAGKRGALDFQPFYVDDTYAMEISDMPAWEVHHLTNSTEKNSTSTEALSATAENNGRQQRVARSNYRRRTEDFFGGGGGGGFPLPPPPQNKRPWECEAKIKWLDLGHDYYPRYLRTVECTRHSCFYGHFTCKPRSFTVKILRRRRGECVQTKNKVGTSGLPGELKELWVWEERAVNFCCDCAAK